MVGGGAARAGVVLVFGREAGDQTVPVAEFEQLGCAEVFVVEDGDPAGTQLNGVEAEASMMPPRRRLGPTLTTSPVSTAISRRSGSIRSMALHTSCREMIELNALIDPLSCRLLNACNKEPPERSLDAQARWVAVSAFRSETSW